MDIHMCTYPSPLISDQYDYNIYNVECMKPRPIYEVYVKTCNVSSKAHVLM